MEAWSEAAEMFRDTIETRTRAMRMISRAQLGPVGCIIEEPAQCSVRYTCSLPPLHPPQHYIPLPYEIPTSQLMPQPKYDADGMRTAHSELDVDYVDEA